MKENVLEFKGADKHFLSHLKQIKIKSKHFIRLHGYLHFIFSSHTALKCKHISPERIC